jgi:hypothetical protein
MHAFRIERETAAGSVNTTPMLSRRQKSHLLPPATQPLSAKAPQATFAK